MLPAECGLFWSYLLREKPGGSVEAVLGPVGLRLDVWRRDVLRGWHAEQPVRGLSADNSFLVSWTLCGTAWTQAPGFQRIRGFG
jgi:hypothetical protein